MIIKVGNDIIEIARIKKAWERHGERFLNKIFTKQEQDYCLSKKAFPERHIAGRFAAKEALSKTLGTGIGPISWLDFEILNNAQGKPIVTPSERVLALQQNAQFDLSISHCHDYATAVAVLFINPVIRRNHENRD
mgnify:CR=1 FL=1